MNIVATVVVVADLQVFIDVVVATLVSSVVVIKVAVVFCSFRCHCCYYPHGTVIAVFTIFMVTSDVVVVVFSSVFEGVVEVLTDVIGLSVVEVCRTALGVVVIGT